MVAILTLLFALTFSMLTTRIGAIALAHTGLSRESARFQARSAFTGVGFTTAESESLVNHPVRRRILMILMLFGNAGIVTVVSSLIVAFLAFDKAEDTTSGLYKGVLLVGGLVSLWAVTNSDWVDRRLRRLVGWALERYTSLDVRDYASLLHLTGDYRVMELLIRPEDWLANKSLADSRLRAEGIMVLGIHRDNGHYIGSPAGDTCIHAGDRLLVYGRVPSLEKLDVRGKGWRGDVEHHGAVVEASEVRKREQVEETDDDEPAEPKLATAAAPTRSET